MQYTQHLRQSLRNILPQQWYHETKFNYNSSLFVYHFVRAVRRASAGRSPAQWVTMQFARVGFMSASVRLGRAGHRLP
jgi:hypothetical protein